MQSDVFSSRRRSVEVSAPTPLDKNDVPPKNLFTETSYMLFPQRLHQASVEERGDESPHIICLDKYRSTN